MSGLASPWSKSRIFVFYQQAGENSMIFLDNLINGLSLGSIYAIIALG